MFCNGDTIGVYTSWATGGFNLLDCLLGVGLFAIGVAGAYLLVRIQRKKDAEESAEKASACEATEKANETERVD